jgi:hypothetical protein
VPRTDGGGCRARCVGHLAVRERGSLCARSVGWCRPAAIFTVVREPQEGLADLRGRAFSSRCFTNESTGSTMLLVRHPRLKQSNAQRSAGQGCHVSGRESRPRTWLACSMTGASSGIR